VPASLNLALWPAAGNPQGVDLVVAPLATCQQLRATSSPSCDDALSTTVSGVAMFSVGTLASFNLEAAETVSCSSTV
jgi:hypothetical protein